MPTTVTLLIISSDAEDRSRLAGALAPLGETIDPCGHVAEAVTIAGRGHTAVAIIGLDGEAAPGINAAQAIRTAANEPSLPVVFVRSAEPDAATLRRIYALGSADFVQLPATPEALRAKVAILAELHRLRHRRPMDPLTPRTLVSPQEQFRLLARAVSDYALFFMDLEGRVSEWTTAAEKLFGYAPAEIVGASAAIIFTPEDRAARAPQLEMETAQATGQSLDDRLHLRKDGSRFPVTGRLIALRDPASGALRGFAKILWDATGLRALEENERKYREIFETANEGIWILNAEGRIAVVNQRMAEILGWPIHQLLGHHKTEFVFPDDLAFVHQLFNERRTGRIASSVELRFRRSDGQPVWTLLSARPMYREGVFVGALDMFTDITARKLTELALDENRTRLRLALAAADLGVFFHDGATGQETWDEPAKRLLGLPADAVASVEVLLACVHPDDRERIAEEIRRALATRTPTEFAAEFRVRWPDGTIRHLAANGIAQHRPRPEPTGGADVIGTVRDVTATRQFERELQQKVEERTAKLREKTDQLESFCYSVAHDLRAPLRAINGYAEIIAEDLDTLGRDALFDYLNRIKASTRRLDTLIRDLLAYSRITDVGITVRPVDLGHVVSAVLVELQPEFRARDAEVTVPPQFPHVWAEQPLLEQVMLNLLSNAVKFTPPERRPRVEVLLEPRGPNVRVLVRDNGIGIEPEYRDRIFKVFERLQAASGFPGTGIGLAIVAKAMERLGAPYGVESQPGVGSTFWIELHLAA